MDAGNRKAPENPKEKASFLSSVFFFWTFKVLRDGYHRVFDLQDICRPMKDDYSSVLGDRIEEVWNATVKKAKNKNETPSLFTTILKTFGKEYTMLGIVHGINEIGIQLARPYFLGLLLGYFKPGSTTTETTAMLAAGGISCCTILTSVFGQHYLSRSLCIGMKVRVACVSLVYRKCLKLGRTALGEISPGQVVNLVSNDVSRFDLVTVTCHYMWSAPILACIIAVILYGEIGYAGLIGILVVFIVVPLLSYVGRLTSQYRFQIALKTDERVRLTDEIVTGIQVIKMYAWEKPFSKLLLAARKAELDIVTKTTFLRGLYMTFNLTTTRVALFSTLLAIILSGGHLTADKVFVVAAYFGSLTQTFSGMFVRGFAEISESLVSIRRLQGFLFRGEYKSQVKLNISKNEKGDDVPQTERVYLQNVTAAWHPDNTDQPTLSSINCVLEEGSLCGIIGSVGSGKSSFLQLLLGEVSVLKGDIEIRGTVSYASQEAWVFAGSVRQNILFGQPYERKRYRHVTQVCALERDFELFPHGDMTLVGERGASLSGGQKARINLARAVYRNADVYLLDDPLSAVDTHVGKHLFNDCIKGYLSKKTVILVTHQLQYINSVDHIILLDNGVIKTQGTYSDLKKSGLDYAALVTRGDDRKESVSESEQEEKPTLLRMVSRGSVSSSTLDDGSIAGEGGEPVAEAEPEVTRKPGHSIYLDYFRAGTNLCVVVLLIILFLLTQAVASCSDYFVSYWTRMDTQRVIDEKNHVKDKILPSNVLATIHGSLVAGVFVFGLIRASLFCLTCMRCSNGLHTKMFGSVIGTAISFFNNNPSGRILNRFSKDLGMIDEWLPKCLLDVSQTLCLIFGTLVVAIVVNPLFIVPVLLLSAVSIYVRRFFVKTSKNLKRLEGIARSPVFSHLNSTLQGLPTIRALGAQDILRAEFDNHQDLHTGSMFLFIYTSSGFASILDFVCLIFITVVTFSFLLYARGMNSAAGGANAGLAITQALSLAGYLQWGMRASAEIANQMTATERVLEYADLPAEEVDPGSKKTKEDIGEWPQHGKVEMNHMFLYYSKDEPAVLKDVCLEIKAREKVGIVGRTGAGKSSLIQAMFRMCHIEGQILIDGLDTKTLTLECLRSHISIIPQDPVLFSGTMRRNLDPFEEYPDYILWRALDEVELREAMKEEFGLQSRVLDGGTNFSVGQRQLVCLARAIVRNNKILVMDEATANVDPQTDAFIQKTIRTKFSDCTVLTIAHRLNTVMDSDKVLVMDAGKVMEFEHPHNLLQNTNGYFFKLVQETGEYMAQHLAEIAKNSYNELQR